MITQIADIARELRAEHGCGDPECMGGTCYFAGKLEAIVLDRVVPTRVGNTVRSGLSPELVLVESPYAGDVIKHKAYARAALRDCFRRGEYPFASHLLYTQPDVLNDDDPAERKLGIIAGLAWGAHASRTVVYADLGISKGMQLGIDRARELGRAVEVRHIRGNPQPESSRPVPP